jgi:hypothetical protein
MSRKIYNEVVIDMNPESSGYGDTLYEDSFQDNGPIAEMLEGAHSDVYYSANGDRYEVRYNMNTTTNEASYVWYYKNGVLQSESGSNRPASQIKEFNKAYAEGAEGGGIYTPSTMNQDADYEPNVVYRTKEEYLATKDISAEMPTVGEDATFEQLYAGQGADTGGIMLEGKLYDPTKDWAMEEFGITADDYKTMTPLTMEPIEALNVKYQEDVDVFSQQFRDTNVSLTTEIGSIQSMGGFAGESGAITQPLEQQKTLAELGGLTQYGALSSGRFSDIKEEKRIQEDLFYDQGYEFP